MTLKDWEDLALVDKNAARLMAFFLAANEEVVPEERAQFMRIALGFAPAEIDRCVKVLEDRGLGTVTWIN